MTTEGYRNHFGMNNKKTKVCKDLNLGALKKTIQQTLYFKVNCVLFFKEDEKVVETGYISNAQIDRWPQKSKSEKLQDSDASFHVV